MKAVIAENPGDESVLKLGEAQVPTLKPADILIQVTHAGVNRADVLQRQGSYPPPPGVSTIIGLECAGRVAAVGPQARGWKVGERAMALMAGGGYAEQAVAHYGSAMHVPAALSDAEAAGFPEVFLTAFLNLFQLGQVREGEWVLVHAGGSGVGTASLVLLKEADARSIVTAGSDEKCDRCLKLGADVAINYRKGSFVPEVKAATDGRGVDVVLDCVGGPYLGPNIESLAHGGRLLLIGLMQGGKGEIDMGPVLWKHLTIIGSTLRRRPDEEKAAIVSAFLARFGAALEAGRLRPPLYKIVDAADAASAHRMMEKSEHFGKIVLRFA